MGDENPITTVPTSQTSVHTVASDPNHVYFLHSSDSPGMTLVNASLDGKGFQGWKRTVLIVLSAKNKTGFISGSCAAPDPCSNDYQPWSRCNDMVTSWLLNSLSREIADSVIYSRSAKELWTSLEHRFGQSNGAKLYHRNIQIKGYLCQLLRLSPFLHSVMLIGRLARIPADQSVGSLSVWVVLRYHGNPKSKLLSLFHLLRLNTDQCAD